jgi:transcriptional regulator NrdR family protein
MYLSNLALLQNGGSYDDCKKTIIRNVMEEFKNNKLKTRNGTLVTNQKQAMAMALSMAHSKCSMNKEEIKDLIKKVDKDLNNMDKDIILSNLIEIKDVLLFLRKKNKSKHIYVFKNLLWDKIVHMHRNNKKLNSNMWDEIEQINNI